MVKSIFYSILLTVIMAVGLFLCFIIGGAGDLTNSIIFMIIWLVGIGGSAVVSCIVEDEGFEMKTFLWFLIFGVLALAMGIVTMFFMTPNQTADYAIKYALFGVAGLFLATRYIFVGFGKDGIVPTILITSGISLAGFIVFGALSYTKQSMVLMIISFALGGCGILASLFFSLKNKGLADGSWELSSNNYSGRSSSSYSSNSGGGSYGYSNNNSPDVAKPYKGDIEILLFGMSASSKIGLGLVDGKIMRVEYKSNDGGYNYDITIFIKFDINKYKVTDFTTESDIQQAIEEVGTRLRDDAASKLSRNKIGYSLSVDVYS